MSESVPTEQHTEAKPEKSLSELKKQQLAEARQKKSELKRLREQELADLKQKLTSVEDKLNSQKPTVEVKTEPVEQPVTQPVEKKQKLVITTEEPKPTVEPFKFKFPTETMIRTGLMIGFALGSFYVKNWKSVPSSKPVQQSNKAPSVNTTNLRTQPVASLFR